MWFTKGGRSGFSLSQNRRLRRSTLKVGDQPPVTGQAGKLLARQPQEDFCLGHDNGMPVAAYTGKGAFQGRFTGLKITTP